MGAKNSRTLSPQTIDALKNDVGVDFSAEEIKTWYDEYKSSLGKGQTELTREEFKRVYNSLFLGDASDFAEQVFRTFDIDNSGTVDFKEFIAGLCVSGSSDYETKLKWAFKMYDINGDGYICKHEMTCIISAIYKMTHAILPEDINTPEKLANKWFRDFDLNQDGRISWEEFRQGADKNSVIVSLLECDPDPEN